MVEVEDAVRASQADIQRMLARSHHIWSSFSKEANPQNGLQPCYIQLRNILGRVPAFLANGSPQLRLEQRGSKVSELFISGQSTWRTTKDCGLEDKIIPYQLLLGTQSSTPCYFANDSRFANWPALQGEGGSAVGGNYLAILAFAWAYIVSARWVEMQQSDAATYVSVPKNDRIFYLAAEAKSTWTCGCSTKSPDELEVDLGDVDDDTARWWAAILATGEGWRAEITRIGTVYRSPWSIRIAATQRFKIWKLGSNQNMHKHTFVAPSSETALRYLSDFSAFHCIDSQCSVALATTLTFPFLGARSANLPLPNLLSANTMRTSPHPSLVERHQKKGTVLLESKLLPYYMTLSCNTCGMYALLCGSFFDPQVSCNLVSPWFQPILEIIGPLVKAGDFEKVAIIMGKRQPKLAALCMGAAISGMADAIFQGVRIGLIAIELHVSAWTATTHSFISLKSEIPYGNDDTEISRSDECRLLYLAETDGHSRLPICPWRPFGRTKLRDSEIEVRQHAKCMGHHLRYISWSWNLHDGTVLEDLGFAIDEESKDTSVATIESGSLDLEDDIFLKDEVLSENATRSIFGWLRNSGWPKNEKEIYSHSWIDFDDSDEEVEDTKSDGGAKQDANTQQAIEGWVLEQHHTWYCGIHET
jgi:hypothetical protein